MRARIGARRQSMSRELVDAGSRRIVEQALSLQQLLAARTVALYAAIANEVDTRTLAHSCRARGIRTVYPRVGDDRRSLVFREVHSPADLVPGTFGIPEPTEGPVVDLADVDVIFVPGLVFDRGGGRLGYGKGFYDRALSGLTHPLKVGLAWAFQVLPRGEAVPTSPHDVPMDVVVTEDMVLRVGR